MILTAHQPVYLPWLGFFHKLSLVDTFCALDHVQYIKNDVVNRNQIKTKNGPLWLTVPAITKNHFQKPFFEVEIDNSQPWAKKHLKSIYYAYSQAKFFSRYIPFFESTYSKSWHTLYQLNSHLINYFLEELGLKPILIRSSSLQPSKKKNDLILELCQKLKADTFIFGAMGKNYADKKSFAKNNIRIYFQDYRHPVYPQMYGPFIPNMSIIDLLFNCGLQSLAIILSGNITKNHLLFS